MVKLVACLKRKPGISVADFQRHWRTQHADIVVRQAGLRRYVQNHVLPECYGASEPLFDGVAEAWFEDVDAMRALAGAPEYRAVRDDEPHFLDVPAMRVVLTDEVVLVDRPASASALVEIAFLTRKAGMPPELFQKSWREKCGPDAARLPSLRRYVQSHARLGGYAAGRAPAFDGVAFAVFDDRASRALARESDLARRLRDVEASFLAAPPPFVLARAVEIDVGRRA
jgi:uncharacterized protein (TIGR02118 family)